MVLILLDFGLVVASAVIDCSMKETNVVSSLNERSRLDGSLVTSNPRSDTLKKKYTKTQISYLIRIEMSELFAKKLNRK